MIHGIFRKGKLASNLRIFRCIGRGRIYFVITFVLKTHSFTRTLCDLVADCYIMSILFLSIIWVIFRWYGILNGDCVISKKYDTVCLEACWWVGCYWKLSLCSWCLILVSCPSVVLVNRSIPKKSKNHAKHSIYNLLNMCTLNSASNQYLNIVFYFTNPRPKSMC